MVNLVGEARSRFGARVDQQEKISVTEPANHNDSCPADWNGGEWLHIEDNCAPRKFSDSSDAPRKSSDSSRVEVITADENCDVNYLSLENDWILSDPLKKASEDSAADEGSSANFDWFLEEHVPSVTEFVHVQQTPACVARLFAQRRPRAASAILWAWLAVLILGEAATTIWWLISLGPRGPLILGAPLGLGFSLALAILRLEQAASFTVSILLAAMPAVPAYSAVLLIIPHAGVSGSETSWEVVHLPTLICLGLLHLTAALLPSLKAEHRAPGRLLHLLWGIQHTARGLCIVAAWLYAAAILHMAAARISAFSPAGPHLEDSVNVRTMTSWSSGPLAGSRGLALCLHSLGLLCAEARRRSTSALGPDLLPRLLGDARARSLAPRALVAKNAPRLVRVLPLLRNFSLPPIATALVVAVRRTAPVLVPALAVVLQLASPEWPISFILAPAVITAVAILAIAVFREWRQLPRGTLRRLPLLLPSGVGSRTRACMGHALVAAEKAEALSRRAMHLGSARQDELSDRVDILRTGRPSSLQFRRNAFGEAS